MEIGGRRLKNVETMAVGSVTQSGPPPRSNKTYLENPKIPIAVALLIADAVFVFLIIAFVPCKFHSFHIPSMYMLILYYESDVIILNLIIISDTKIDWDAYMSQVKGFLEGERDYRNLKGDTGPLVYPAGFLYIYSAFLYLTGGQVYPAQVIFIICCKYSISHLNCRTLST